MCNRVQCPRTEPNRSEAGQMYTFSIAWQRKYFNFSLVPIPHFADADERHYDIFLFLRCRCCCYYYRELLVLLPLYKYNREKTFFSSSFLATYTVLVTLEIKMCVVFFRLLKCSSVRRQQQ